MDPLTALSVAGTVVQFVDFGTKIVRGTFSLYKSASGALPVNEQLEILTRDLSLLATKLRRPLHVDDAPTGQLQGIPNGALKDLCDECVTVADSLIVRLEELKVQGKHRIWRSLRQAIKAAWAQREVEELTSALSGYRTSIQTHIQSNMRDSITLASVQQSKRFDDLDRNTQNILIALLDSRNAQQEDLLDQRIAIAQMLNRTEVILTYQHNETRELFVNVMQVVLGLKKAGEDFGTVEERRHAETIQQEEENIKSHVGSQILKGLYFEAMTERQDDIEEAHKDTFGWLFNPPKTGQKWSDFTNWLRFGSGIYWINGKAGSGKSTLMRYICECEQTKKELLQWAGSLPLIISGFFFWNGGVIEQKSQTGLLRSLLYNTLQRYPKLIPIVMPSFWARSYSQALNPCQPYKPGVFNLKNLKQIFKTLLKQTLVPLKICFFIDGFDEYEGSPVDFDEIFNEIAASNHVKVCLSSRPLVAYEDSFRESPSLRLQDLTVEDIKLYVHNTLHVNKRFALLSLREPERAPELAVELVSRADGVFLWVKVVVRSILIGLGNRDEISVLQTRLRELPSELDALYEHMLTKRIDSIYREEASKLFQIFRASRDLNERLECFGEAPVPLTLISLSFAYQSDPNLAFTSEIKRLTTLEVSARCSATEHKLKARCAGLLELHEPISKRNSDLDKTDSDRTDSDKTDSDKKGSDKTDSSGRNSGSLELCFELDRMHLRVRYLHRTVRDFLEQPDVWSSLIALTRDSDFDPNVCLLESCILQLKTSPIEDNEPLPDAIWRCTALGLEHSRQAELKQNPAYIALLDQLDLVMIWHTEHKSPRYLGHWARHYLAEYDFGEFERPIDWEDSIMTLAVEYSLSSYLEYKFRQMSSPPFKNAAQKSGRPLLDYAISQNVPKQRYPISPPVVAVLLAHGANPNLRYNPTSAWENALAFAYNTQFPEAGNYLFGSDRRKPSRSQVMDLLTVFRLFISHGADLNASCNIREGGTIRTGDENLAERRPVLYIVKDVFVRWYREESAALVQDLEARNASDELISDFQLLRASAWGRMRRIGSGIWY